MTISVLNSNFMKSLVPRSLLLLHQCSRTTQWSQYAACKGRLSSTLSYLEQGMTSRNLPPIFDYSHQTASKLLYTTVHDAFGHDLHPFDAKHQLMPGYHLVYFPPDTTLSSLLPDGTDPLHSPGPPFNRRMWAGGEVFFNEPIYLEGKPLTCQEHIEDVEVKSKVGKEKVFVTIKREIKLGEEPQETGLNAAIIEKRKLVFMHDRPRPIDAPNGEPAKRDIVKSPHEVTVSRTLTPSLGLLFRFSALTFNAHRIHLDQGYCRDIEGHRNLLVHGPLSLVLMLHLLQSHLKSARAPRGDQQKIVHVEYQCLAPLYAQEELKVCLSRKSPYVWKTWIEGPDGGLAVRGTVTTAEAEPT